LAQRFTPLLRYVSSSSGIPLLFYTAPDFDTFLQRTHTGKEYDLIWTAPHFFLLAEQKGGYRPLARVAGALYGTLVVHRDSGIREVSQLRGKRIGIVDPKAFMTLLGVELFNRHGLRLFRDLEVKPYKSHNSALLGVHKRHVEAALVAEVQFRLLRDEVRRDLRNLAETARTPHMVFAVRPGLEQTVADNLQAVLLNAHTTDEGRSALENAGYAAAFIPVKREEYLPMKRYLTLIEKGENR
jgi:phosphonate transport system substrate-binding protein